MGPLAESGMELSLSSTPPVGWMRRPSECICAAAIRVYTSLGMGGAGACCRLPGRTGTTGMGYWPSNDLEPLRLLAPGAAAAARKLGWLALVLALEV